MTDTTDHMAPDIVRQAAETPPRARGLFVTGTDTEVGKTHVAAALLRLLATSPSQPRVAGYKPVAAGMDAQGGNDDVRILQAASNIALDAADICPMLLPAPCAPHIAARLAGRHIVPDALLAGARALAARTDWLVVEGVGGFCVPLADGRDGTPAWSSADLARQLGFPVVLVVGLRLGCISHALLTAEAISHRGLTLAGWVGNQIDPHMQHVPDNIGTLTHLMQQQWAAPCLGVIPHVPDSPLPSLHHWLDADAIARLQATGQTAVGALP